LAFIPDFEHSFELGYCSFLPLQAW